jgi:hypothetical protein
MSALVKVSITSIDIDVYAACGGDCNFYYHYDLTPLLFSVSEGSAAEFPFQMRGNLRGRVAVCDLSDLFFW